MQIPKESVSHVSVSSDNKQSTVKQICNKIIKGESMELLLVNLHSRLPQIGNFRWWLTIMKIKHTKNFQHQHARTRTILNVFIIHHSSIIELKMHNREL